MEIHQGIRPTASDSGYYGQEMNSMIELHSHSLLSDGALLPTEALRRAEAQGFEAYAITDHVDTGNVDRVVTELVRLFTDLKNRMNVTFIPGVEVTHVPPDMIGDVVCRARSLGARLVLVHGETLAEPVAPGTNRAALQAGCDILVHPGLISEEDVRLAAEKGIPLEISGRRGHCLSNGHVCRLSRRLGAALVINSDAHAPGDAMDPLLRASVGRGAGMSEAEVQEALLGMKRLVSRCLKEPACL